MTRWLEWLLSVIYIVIFLRSSVLKAIKQYWLNKVAVFISIIMGENIIEAVGSVLNYLI